MPNSGSIAYSGPKAPAIPIQTRHHFRFDPATDSDRGLTLPGERQFDAGEAAVQARRSKTRPRPKAEVQLRQVRRRKPDAQRWRSPDGEAVRCRKWLGRTACSAKRIRAISDACRRRHRVAAACSPRAYVCFFCFSLHAPSSNEFSRTSWCVGGCVASSSSTSQ